MLLARGVRVDITVADNEFGATVTLCGRFDAHEVVSVRRQMDGLLDSGQPTLERSKRSERFSVRLLFIVHESAA